MTTTNLPIPLMRESERPFIVSLLEWNRENQQSVLDLVILSILGGLSFYFLIVADIAEIFFEFSRQHETWELDEIVLALAIVLPIYLSIFAIRRWGEANKRLHQANTDSLTGLFNRRKGWATLELEIKRAKRYGRPLSVVAIDIDHFKSVNDKYGHLTGDLVLREVSHLTQNGLRNTDVFVRWGGEEFMIISTETELLQAHHMAERLRRTIEQHIIPKVTQVTASFGVAQLEKEDDAISLMTRVDNKLYEAKSSGRNKVV